MASSGNQELSSTRIGASFRDVAELGRMAGFDLGFRQLDFGPQNVPATLHLGVNTTVACMRFNRAYHQVGVPPTGMLTFGIPICGLRNWFGGSYRASSILPFDVPGGIDGVSDPGFEAFTLSVSEHFVRDVADIFQVPITELLGNPSAQSFIADSEATRLLRGQLLYLFADEQALLSKDVEDELMVALLHAAHTKTIEDRSSPTHRSLAIARAMAYIEGQEGEALTVRAICGHTGIAMRTLNRAFRERFGIGTKAYVVRHRLSGVRADLLSAEPGVLVADVANRWGFWHMGQFARDYVKTYGELPSETLRGSRR